MFRATGLTALWTHRQWTYILLHCRVFSNIYNCALDIHPSTTLQNLEKISALLWYSFAFDYAQIFVLKPSHLYCNYMILLGLNLCRLVMYMVTTFPRAYVPRLNGPSVQNARELLRYCGIFAGLFISEELSRQISRYLSQVDIITSTSRDICPVKST